MIRRAIYCGSFDPPHLGHMWMMFEANGLFDETIVLIADNVDKKPLIPVQDRLELIKKMMKGINRVSVDILTNGFLVDYSLEKEAPILLRGIRNTNDFIYEKDMMEVNTELGQDFNRYVYLIPPRGLCHISSSLVRSLLKIEGGINRIRKFIPLCVFEYLKEKS